MADFRSWSQENLARFCEESQAEIVRLNNSHSKFLQQFKALIKEYEKLSDECVKKPERNHVYRASLEVFETQ